MIPKVICRFLQYLIQNRMVLKAEIKNKAEVIILGGKEN